MRLADGVPAVQRSVDEELFAAFTKATYESKELPRVARAMSQYQVALSNWTTSRRALSLAHLYMALENLGPAIERREREALGLATAKEHAVHRGVDVTKGNWKEVLLGWLRRDVLCQGARKRTTLPAERVMVSNTEASPCRISVRRPSTTHAPCCLT